MTLAPPGAARMVAHDGAIVLVYEALAAAVEALPAGVTD